MNVYEQIQQVLINGGVSNVTIGDLPTDLDVCVSLFSLQGTRQSYFGGSHLDIQPIRIVVRDNSYAQGLNTFETIKTLLTNYTNSTILSTHVKYLDAYLGKDDKRRNVWDMTCTITY